jgi:hypothetical protein
MEAKQFGAYVFYPDGRVYSTFKNRFLKPYVSSNGYEIKTKWQLLIRGL